MLRAPAAASAAAPHSHCVAGALLCASPLPRLHKLSTLVAHVCSACLQAGAAGAQAAHACRVERLCRLLSSMQPVQSGEHVRAAPDGLPACLPGGLACHDGVPASARNRWGGYLPLSGMKTLTHTCGAGMKTISGPPHPTPSLPSAAPQPAQAHHSCLALPFKPPQPGQADRMWGLLPACSTWAGRSWRAGQGMRGFQLIVWLSAWCSGACMPGACSAACVLVRVCVCVCRPLHAGCMDVSALAAAVVEVHEQAHAGAAEDAEVEVRTARVVKRTLRAWLTKRRL